MIFTVDLTDLNKKDTLSLACSEVKISQLPSSNKQFLISLILPNFLQNPQTQFSPDQSFDLLYRIEEEDQQVSLLFRSHYKGFNLLTRKEKNKLTHEINLVFAGVLQSQESSCITSPLLSTVIIPS